jgi:hypothetical protein
MSQLREEVHKNDFLMDKLTKDMYFIIRITDNDVWLRHEAEGDDVELKQMPKHMVNLSMIKVNPDVIKVLYGDRNGEVDKDEIPSTDSADASSTQVP